MNQSPSRRSQFFQVAEYTSAAASVVGVVVSAVSQQVVYAAAPLSLSVCLNLVNRRRFEQQTAQQLTSAIAQLDQRIQVPLPANDAAAIEQISQLRQQFTAIEGITDQTELRSRLAQLAEQFTTLQQRQNTNQAEEQSRLSQVRGEIEAIRQRFQALDEIETLQRTIARLEERADQTEVRSRLVHLAEQFATLQQQQSNFQTQITQILDRFSQTVQQEMTSRLEEKVDRSELRTRSAEELARFAQFSEELTAFQQRQAELQAQLSEVQAQFSQAIQQQIQTTPTEQIAELPTIELPPILEEPIEVEPPDTPIDEPTDELEILALNLGIDFGTSFTKVCFRDLVNDRSEIVTFTNEVTKLDEALLPTKIAILPDGRLLTGLTASEWQDHEQPEHSMVEFIKMRLAHFDLPESAGNWKFEQIPGATEAEAIENLCAYYLSRVISRAQAWIRRNKPELILNQNIEWSANVGVPVEYCDSKAIERFRTVLSLAWLLSNEPQTEAMTLQNLHTQLQPLRAKLETTTVDCHAVPEIAAEVWSLINSREADTGFYLLFDVGDGTLDGCSFHYWNDQGEKKVDFYFGKVNPLGVTAFSQSLADELGVTEIDVKQTLFGDSKRFVDRIQTSKSRKAIQQSVAKVVLEGTDRYKKHGFQLTPHGVKKPLDIRIGGGGGQTDFYRKAIVNTHQDFQHKNRGIPDYKLESLPTPKDLETNGIDSAEFYRFAVAYGLSIPEGEQPEIRLPSQMEQNQPNFSRSEDPLGKPPSYEDMRGA
ncbi:hypothetical protein ACQ4M3_19610 [Leptolyngbya sp. AN03gr2]|uniref:hypothetical protein n=1 Tax=unclassified Leptolyngbya TaxID=2650499 RepID=UPI003D311C99